VVTPPFGRVEVYSICCVTDLEASGTALSDVVDLTVIPLAVCLGVDETQGETITLRAGRKKGNRKKSA
jgi:hypothetical protein